MISPESVRVLFMGTAHFAVPSLEALIREGFQMVGVVTQPPRPAGRGQKVTMSAVAQAAERVGLPVIAPVKLRSPEAQAEVANFRPDLIVVAAYGQVLPPSVLAVPPRGCVNVHGSLAPRWRGASPIQASILAGDEFTGVTIMVMEAGLDSGPILSQSVTRIEEQDTALTLEDRLSRMGAELLVATLPEYLDGSLQATPQDEALATCAPVIKKEAGRIDWSRPALEIWRANRAYQPWPGSYSYWNGRMLKIGICQPEASGGGAEPPGTVVAMGTSKEAGVVTGSGVLRLEQVALEGSRPMGISEFLAGHRTFIGSLLG